MAHRFDLATLQAVDISNCAPGFYWQLSPQGGDAKLILKLEPGNPQHLLFVCLSGEHSFNTRYGRMPAAGNSVVLPLNISPLKIELPDATALASNRESLGALVVCKEGAYLAVQDVDGQAFGGFGYVSLSNFTIDEYLPSHQYGVFTTWRLTTSETNPSERTALLSQGDWP